MKGVMIEIGAALNVQHLNRSTAFRSAGARFIISAGNGLTQTYRAGRSKLGRGNKE